MDPFFLPGRCRLSPRNSTSCAVCCMNSPTLCALLLHTTISLQLMHRAAWSWEELAVVFMQALPQLES